MSTRNRGCSRRSFLGGLGLGAIAAALPPFFSNIPTARAALPKRFVVFFTPNEPLDRQHWFPGGSRSAFDLPAKLPAMMEPLTPHRDKLLMIGDMAVATRIKIGKNGDKGGHDGIGHMLTGVANISTGPGNAEFWAGGPSVDQFIAAQLNLGAPLTLGARTGGNNGNCRISYTGANEPVQPIDDPAIAFQQVFSGFTGSPAEQDAYKAQRRSVLEAVTGHTSTLKARLPGDDRLKLERHLDSITSLQSKLQNTGALTCGQDSIGLLENKVNGGYDPKSNADYPVTGRLQMDILVQALACGARNVGSIQLGNSGAGEIEPNWPDEGVVINSNEHLLAHQYAQEGAAYEADRVKLEKFYFKQFAYLLNALDSVQEGDGTLLDNTLVLWTKNLAMGHKWDPMLYMLAGGGALGVETGRFLSFPGKPHNHLLAAICQIMGVPNVTGYGDPDFKGVLAL